MISNSELFLIEREYEQDRSFRDERRQQLDNWMQERECNKKKKKVVVFEDVNHNEDEDCFSVNPLTNQVKPRA